MTHNMVYFVSGDSYSDLGALKRAGIVDLHYVIHGGGSSAPASVVSDCNAAGMSPILNNGNDGAAGWNGSDSYNANIAAQGWHAVGGESEQAAEIDSIMNHLVFLDYGGQGTGGGTNDDVWNVTHPGNVHGYGAAGYYETYDASTNFWGWNVVGSGMTHAKAHGVKEIGIMVGTWMINHSTAQNYIQLAQDMESHGITCAGIGVWGGYGNNANNVYNTFASWYKAWQAIWPPETRTMKQRFTGPTPPTPPAGVTFAGSPVTAADGSIYIRGSDSALWRSFGGKWASLGGKITGQPSISSDGKDIYAIGADNNALYHRTLTAGWIKIADKIQ